MLTQLRIRGLGAIDEAQLSLSGKFTAITGETGAGKTMVLTALALLLGDRADAGAIGTHSDRLDAEGIFNVTDHAAAIDLVTEAGGEIEDGDLVLARSVSKEGRSRAMAGGRTVSVATLSDIGEQLVTVHGQADQRGLLRPSLQREVLDRFGGAELAALRAGYVEAFRDFVGVTRELARLRAEARERAREADLLRLGLGEIEAVAPVPGEIAALQAESAKLAHVEALRLAAASALDQLDADDDVTVGAGRIAAARGALDAAAGHDGVLDALNARIAEIAVMLADVSTDLSSYLHGLDADPHRLASVQERIAAIATLTRKYGENAEAVLAWAEESSRRLLELDSDDSRLEELAVKRSTLEALVIERASALRAARLRAANRLEVEVSAELAGLAMPNAALGVEVRTKPDDHGLPIDGERLAFGQHGIDEVEFLFAAHAGATPRPLQRGASGGELSRVMLALEVVLAGADSVPTFVFDEIDAGVGGRAAVEIGRRLARLATAAQVVVVTHLPQVAAFADQHLVVAKTEANGGTSTTITEVSGEARLTELSRMLSGLEDSQLGRGHAAELLRLAATPLA